MFKGSVPGVGVAGAAIGAEVGAEVGAGRGADTGAGGVGVEGLGQLELQLHVVPDDELPVLPLRDQYLLHQ